MATVVGKMGHAEVSVTVKELIAYCVSGESPKIIVIKIEGGT